MHFYDLFYESARNHPQRLLFTGDGGDFSYGDARSRLNRIARQMLAEGLGNETRFAVLSPNCGRAMISIMGCLRAGAVWCTLNLRNTPADNIQILSSGGCTVLYYHSSAEALAQDIQSQVPTIRRVVCLDAAGPLGPFLDDWVAAQPETAPDLRVDESTLVFQGATGGTTGAPKLTLSDSRALLTVVQGWSMCLHFDDTPPVNLAVAPITHAAGMVALGQIPFGGTIVMMGTPSVDYILDAIEKRRISVLYLPPTLIYALLAHPRAASTDFSSLRYLLSAGAPISPDKVVEAVKVFGPVLCQAFGQTEGGFPLTFMSPAETAAAARDPALRRRLLSCGRPTPIVEAMDCIDEAGHALPADETGELALRGPMIMRAYLNDPKATSEIQKAGWHLTGDIGCRDADGYIYITDRKRDMVVSGGFNIFPFEIEAVMNAHPAVQECAVIGVPDAKWGEAVKAVVQLKPGATASEAELIAYCKERIGSMKTPKSVDFEANLPRSPVGKVLKRELRKRYWVGQERGVS